MTKSSAETATRAAPLKGADPGLRGDLVPIGRDPVRPVTGVVTFGFALCGLEG